MNPTIKCPVCGSKLEKMTMSHIKSKKHEEALENAKIKNSEDPALKLLKLPEINTENLQYKSEDDMKLEVPLVPEPPKRKKLELNSAEMPVDLSAMKRAEKAGKKAILVNCERCNGVIFVPVPPEMVLNSELPVVPITYVHYNPERKDKHGITIYLDHDFDIRRQRLSDIIFQE
ncbi:MAG: hypothetical protein ACFFBP_17530 [Promethearchaeota archaeon]